MSNFKQNRRAFLKTAAITVTAFTIVPRRVLGGNFLAPSDELTKAIIGTGGMGRG
ncbi:MAG: twin-arginine translocation signal domain-containing protein, partial [Prevotellaceae bacterium]|nr:twin-arginine translocation signal domain-containing protein [Prevotellaceae bacterium]